MLDRDRNPGLPTGETQFIANDVTYTGNFIKIALNVAHRAGNPGNVLGDLLRSWFGPDAGQPGTVQFVELVPGKPHWQMRPVSPHPSRDESVGLQTPGGYLVASETAPISGPYIPAGPWLLCEYA